MSETATELGITCLLLFGRRLRRLIKFIPRFGNFFDLFETVFFLLEFISYIVDLFRELYRKWRREIGGRRATKILWNFEVL